MLKSGFVSRVGRPNVGNSTLMNNVVGEKIAIIKDIPGVTRDRIYADCQWRGTTFQVIDTGGIEPESDDIILKQMRRQAELAMDIADVSLLDNNSNSSIFIYFASWLIIIHQKIIKKRKLLFLSYSRFRIN